MKETVTVCDNCGKCERYGDGNHWRESSFMLGGHPGGPPKHFCSSQCEYIFTGKEIMGMALPRFVLVKLVYDAENPADQERKSRFIRSVQEAEQVFIDSAAQEIIDEES